ncbi:MAG TPA: ComEC/Rec2 family competence protein [Candidatus Dormibacteraeota bacterium]|nr:ComEC/Rec2 family competence protein [Candidatus Dormibacteraeota bacterium]
MRAVPEEAAAPTVLVAGAFAAGLSLCAAGAVPPAVPPAVALAGGGAGIAAALRSGRRRALALAAAALLAATAGMLRGGGSPPGGGLPLAAGAVALDGTVRDAPAVRRGESLVTVDVERVAGAGGDRAATGGVLAAVRGRPDLGPGDRVRLEAASLRAPGDRPGATSAAALQRDGVGAVAVSPRITRVATGPPRPARLLAAVRTHLATVVGAALPPVTASLLLEISFGVHGTLPVDVAGPLRDAGLVHLVATSGLKVAIVVGLLTRVATLMGVAPRRRLLLVGPAVAAYVAIAGGGAAAARSALMAGVSLLTRGSGRRVEPLALLAATAAVLLAVEPRLHADAGFQLSFLGTLGILLLAGPIAARVPGPRLLAEPFAVTLAAQVATVPVMASTFGVLSLVGPLANALVIPIVPAMVVLGWAGASLAAIAPALGWPLLAGGGLLTAATILLSRALAAVPHAALHLAGWPRAWTWALVAGLCAGAPGLRAAGRGGRVLAAGAAVASAAAVLLVLSRPDGRLHVTVLDTGASAATLVRTGDGATALVDGGSDPLRLAAALERALPPLARSLDLVVLTGGDRTAVAGLAGIATGYRVDAVVSPAADLGAGASAVVDELRAAGAAVVRAPWGRPWTWHATRWRLLPGPPSDTGPPAGALQVVDRGGAALILGALAPPAQEELAAAEGATLRSDLVVTPARGALAPALLEAAHPRLLAVPSARAPRAPADELGVSVRSTALDGSLEYAGGSSGLEPA